MTLKPFQMAGQRGSVDETGVVQWVVPFFVENLSDVLTVGNEPPVPGLLESGRTWTDDFEGQGAGIRVDVTYEGSFGGEQVSYEFDSSFREEPIYGNRNWETLKNVFKGRYDPEAKSVTFPEYLGEYRKGLGLPDGKSKSKDGKLINPLFGVETYLTLSSIFRVSYSRTVIPGSVFSSIGKIRKSIPGGFPTPSDRDWIVMPPKITKRGAVYQITEEYMMSKEGGWPEDVYGLIESGSGSDILVDSGL